VEIGEGEKRGWSSEGFSWGDKGVGECWRGAVYRLGVGYVYDHRTVVEATKLELPFLFIVCLSIYIGYFKEHHGLLYLYFRKL